MSDVKQRYSAWPRVKLGEIGTIVRGNGIKRSDTRQTGNPCLRYGEIYTSYEFVLDKPKSFVSADVFDRSPHIKKGDLVFTLTGETEDEIAKTLAYLGDEEIAAGGDLAVWSNHGCDPKFLAYLMYSPELIKAKALASNGQIIVHISVKKFQQIDISLPPLPVQREIVARLERELGAVDKLAKKFAELEIAAEAEFKAELKDTFKGLSDAKQVKLGDVCEVRAGADYKAVKSSNGVYPIYGTGGEMGRANKSRCPANSVIVGRKGTLNNPLLIKEPFWNIDTCFGVIPSSSILPKYLFAFCQSFDFYSLIPASGRPSTTSTAVRGIEIPLPPLPVQRSIVSQLDAAKAKKEALVAAAKRGRETAALWRKAILKEAFE